MDECLMCEGALMKPISDTKSECPRCGYVVEDDQYVE